MKSAYFLDFVKGHLRALDDIADKTGYFVWNLGTGNGFSALAESKPTRR